MFLKNFEMKCCVSIIEILFDFYIFHIGNIKLKSFLIIQIVFESNGDPNALNI